MNSDFGALGILVAVLSLTTGSSAGSAGTIDVEAVGLKDAKGELVCALYDRAEAFPSETDVFDAAYAQVTDQGAWCRFRGVPAGRYAVAAFHDEDGDRKLKTVLGIPREGFGFSNNARPRRFAPPKFSAAAFDFDGKRKRLSVQMRYP